MSTACRVIKGGQCEITQEYKGSEHGGIDLVNKNYTLGTIVAHSAGTVVGTRNDCKGFEQGTYGNYVKIKHDNGYYTLYAHGQYNSVKVKNGQRVDKGTELFAMGNTGYSFGGHLHFEVRNTSDIKINPTQYINCDLPSNESNLDKYTDEELAKMVWDGIFGNGEERKIKLGNRYSKVQNLVNQGIGKIVNTRYKLGDKVIINGVYVSSTSTNKLVPLITKGEITRIIEGAHNPYLLNNGNIGWVNDEVIKELVK